MNGLCCVYRVHIDITISVIVVKFPRTFWVWKSQHEVDIIGLRAEILFKCNHMEAPVFKCWCPGQHVQASLGKIMTDRNFLSELYLVRPAMSQN